MSIPIIDINAGDTVSTMVDKINYNFTLVSLKGGGPAGIQGIQGIRGSIGVQGNQGPIGLQGSQIYSGENLDPENMNVGDINIYDGIIQQVVVGSGGTHEFSTITNLNRAVQSPFGISEHNTINPVSDQENTPIVFGMGTGRWENSVIESQNPNSVLHIVNNGGDLVKFYENGQVSDSSCLGNIATDGNNLKISAKNSNSLILSGAVSSETHSLQFCTDGIYFPARTDINTESVYGNDIFLLMATCADNGKMNGTNDTAKWAMSSGELFPIPVVGSDNAIGRFGNNISGNNDGTCIDKIYLKNNASIVQTGISDLDNIDTTSLKFVSKETIGSNEENIMQLTKYGIALGSLNTNVNVLNAEFDEHSFSIIMFPPQINKSARFCIGANNIINSSVVATSVLVKNLMGNDIDFGLGSPDYSIRGEITLASSASIDNFIYNRYSPLISSLKRTDIDKNANDTLHIHGADGSLNTGCDVVITGGNTVNTNNFSYVGGDVYISGGSALRNSTNKVDSDLRRAGNVIIGINPLNHSGIFNRNNYTSTGGIRQNSEKIPEGIGFYDINNVAVHGNKITIDSNANFRMLTEQYTKQVSSSAVSKVMPYISNPDDATVSISGVNTMNHNEPIVVSQEDVCSHQFMSGVMKRIIRIKYEEQSNTFSVTSVSPNVFKNSYINYTSNDTDGSVYFMTDQIWQKIGNVVNVQAYGRWLANKRGEQRLYYIKDHMFYQKNGGQQWDIGGNQWFSNGTCKNKTLGKLLVNNSGGSAAYNKLYSRLVNQPMTTFVLPFTIKDVNATNCYGNGNIYTETPCFGKQYLSPAMERSNYTIVNNQYHPSVPIQLGIKSDIYWRERTAYDQDPTYSVIMSTPVTVGCFFRKSNYDYEYGFGTDNSDTKDGTGGYGALHDTNSAVNNAVDLTSSAQLYGDERMSAVSSGHMWDESRFRKTDVFNMSYGRNYIYPEMLVDFGNKQLRDPSYSDIGLYMRPCVGMYTWISLNYSYCLMNGFNCKYTGFNYKDNSVSEQDDFENMPDSPEDAYINV